MNVLRKLLLKKNKEKNELIPEPLIRTIIREICNEIKEIHSKKVIHRDLKPENIFISDDYKIKIGDFGISKMLDGTSHATTGIGTWQYIAPEIVRGVKYTNKVDVWSLGCIIYELCTLKRCFDANNFINGVEKIKKGIHGKIDLNFYNENLQNMIDSLLKLNDKERPNIEEVYNLITKKISLNEFKKMPIPDFFGYKIQLGEKRLSKNGDPGWKVFIDNQLLNKKKNGNIYTNILIDAGIIGFDGKPWFCTQGIQLNNEEIENLKNILVNKSSSQTTLKINGKNYQITNYNKGLSISFKLDNIGGTIAKTYLALIIGIYDQNKFYKIDGQEKNQNFSICKETVEDFAKYLIDLNY